ncbi:MAG: hypothetical protein H6739_02000 [Alphaproteobacteria bacterium]|nr:hypothetical protein [Alphaproteobacteria bacterium]
MNAQLRRRHQRALFALTAVLPVGAMLGLNLRAPEPVMDSLPAALSRQPAGDGPALRQAADLWEGATWTTTVTSNGGPLVVTLTGREPLRQPEPLLYWSAERPELGGALPRDAWLLGAVPDDPTLRFALPARVPAPQGWLLVYALGHSEVVARAPLGEGAP